MYISDKILTIPNIIFAFVFYVAAIFAFGEASYIYNIASKYEQKLYKYKVILISSFSFLTLGFYPIVFLFNIISETKKIGTFRKLIEGNEVIRDFSKAERRLRSELTLREPIGYKFYKNLRFPRHIEVLNILITGGMGSGKTVFLAPITLEFYERNYRSVILDNKEDFCQLLAGKKGVTILSPFDARSPAWDVSQDVENELEAIEFVCQLIPTHGSSNDIFAEAARDLVLGSIKYLQNVNPRNWSIGDVLPVLSRNDLLTIFKEHHAGGLETLKDCFEENGKLIVGETSAKFFQNVRTNLKNFEILAKAWPESKNGFSVKKWSRDQLKDTLFLIVPFKQIYPEISGFFSSIVLNAFIKESLNLSDSRTRRLGLFLDELGAIPRVNSLANGGKLLRAKGVCVFVGIQEVGVIRKKYEQDGGTEVLLNAFSTKIIGRAETPEYAEYFVRAFGKNKYEKTTRSRSTDSNGKTSSSFSKEEVFEDAISTGEFLSIPPASMKTGAIFFFKCSELPVIFKLKFPIIPLERPYEGNIVPKWLSDINESKSLIPEKLNINNTEEKSLNVNNSNVIASIDSLESILIEGATAKDNIENNVIENNLNDLENLNSLDTEELSKIDNNENIKIDSKNTDKNEEMDLSQLGF
jgi:type IV secretory pathway TraG/TraD family ATPase VirD4